MGRTAQPFLRLFDSVHAAFAVAAILLFIATQALADGQPFDLDSSSWMSFDRYKDKPSNWLTPDQRNAALAQPVVVPPPVLPASMPITQPASRPIVEPVMPGLNRDFDIKVDSTEDGHLLPALRPDQPNGALETRLPDSQWKNAVDVARNEKNKHDAMDGIDGAAFNVRYTALPAWFDETHKKKPAMTPVPSALAPVKIAQPVVPPPPPAPAAAPALSPADAAACAALEAYKKRQLQAIQSDRETLTALQNAIAQLGLQKQLDFLPGVSGSLDAEQGRGVKPSPAVSVKN